MVVMDDGVDVGVNVGMDVWMDDGMDNGVDDGVDVGMVSMVTVNSSLHVLHVRSVLKRGGGESGVKKRAPNDVCHTNLPARQPLCLGLHAQQRPRHGREAAQPDARPVGPRDVLLYANEPCSIVKFTVKVNR